MFESEYIKIIIEFLYSKFSSRIIQLIMPLFLFNYIAIFIMMYLAEEDRKNEEVMSGGGHTAAYQGIVQIVFILSLINFLIFVV